jgi:transcriptional regulator with XRE-family HTH domain
MGAGQRVRSLRKAKEMTQPTLARLVGVNQSTLSDIENGSGFSAEILMKLAEHLESPAEYIMRGETAAWPFRRVSLERFLLLKPEDRSYVEGRLAALIEQFEQGQSGNLTNAHAVQHSSVTSATTETARKDELFNLSRGAGDAEVDQPRGAQKQRVRSDPKGIGRPRR